MHKSANRRPMIRLNLECLEDRTMPSVTLTIAHAPALITIAASSLPALTFPPGGHTATLT